jgi:hypothetical protein
MRSSEHSTQQIYTVVYTLETVPTTKTPRHLFGLTESFLVVELAAMKSYIAGLLVLIALFVIGSYSWYESTFAGQDADPDEMIVQNNFPAQDASQAQTLAATSTLAN